MLGAALALGGGILSGIGSYANAQAKAGQLDFNARQSMIDAQIAIQNADIQARALRKHGRKIVGQQRTKRAISGIRLEGTPLEVMADTMENIELDAIATRQQGRFQSAQSKAQAKYQSSMADSTRMAGTIGLVSGILGGSSSAGMFS